jgi:hypothetical protein
VTQARSRQGRNLVHAGLEVNALIGSQTSIMAGDYLGNWVARVQLYFFDQLGFFAMSRFQGSIDLGAMKHSESHSSSTSSK